MEEKEKSKRRIWFIIGSIIGLIILYRVLTPVLKVVFPSL